MAGNNSRFLPGSITNALKSLMVRVFGALVMLLGVWATLALVFYNPYLDGMAVASNFGNQSVMGHVVGLIKYLIGTVPGCFVLLCVARWGASRFIGLNTGDAPEYNFLRGFITVCLGGFLLSLGFSVWLVSFGWQVYCCMLNWRMCVVRYVCLCDGYVGLQVRSI